MPTVELIFDADCPNARDARAQLEHAFAETGLHPLWQEWDRGNPSSPAYVRGYGSPTILVDGKDVVGTAESNSGASCRVYRHESGQLKGFPPLEVITAALQQAKRAKPPGANATPHKRHWGSGLAVLPGIGVALLPGLTCPACWPAYASFLGTLGVGFFNYMPYLAPLTAVFLPLAVASLGYRAKQRRGYGPFVLGLAAAIVMAIGKFIITSDPTTYTGIALLVSASVWNGWPKRSKSANSCPACVAAEGGGKTAKI